VRVGLLAVAFLNFGAAMFNAFQIAYQQPAHPGIAAACVLISGGFGGFLFALGCDAPTA
jgi:hypothetical protein